MMPMTLTFHPPVGGANAYGSSLWLLLLVVASYSREAIGYDYELRSRHHLRLGRLANYNIAL